MTSEIASAPEPRPRLYVVALAHLDTQWRWTVRDTAGRFLPDTVRANERLFDRFPGFVLSFEGAARYRLLAQCHPELLEVVRRRVREGRWYPAGAAWEAFDANLPAPESLVRQILLGRLELERAVGLASDDLFLPDCFGFSRSLPTVAAHCSIAGFLTQKLRRGDEMRAAYGIPFPLGRWRGPDGAEILAALDPGEYGAQTRQDLSRSGEWIRKLEHQVAAGLPAALPTLQGLGDKGGAIDEETAEWLQRAAASDGPLAVSVAPSNRLFHDLSTDERAALPVHDGDLLLRLHATGCYTSRSQLKRWHRHAEALAQASERAAALAAPFRSRTDRAASRDSLRAGWERVLSHEMHDDVTGTSLPDAYRFSAGDLAAALNEFSTELEEAVATIAADLDTDTEGEPIVVFNPLSHSRHELVEVRNLEGFESEPEIFDAHGFPVPSQWRRTEAGWRGCFLADVPGLSLSIYEARAASPGRASRDPSGLDPSPGQLENERYRATIDLAGDLASWADRRSGRELLASPAGIELLDNRSERFPSWEIRYEDVARPARSRVAGAARSRWIEAGPLRHRLRVEQQCERSRWRRDYVMSSGTYDAAEVLEIDVRVDWRTDATLAKAAFPFAWEFPEALYDLGVGVAPRPVSSAELYEVPAQSWAAAPFAGSADSGGAVLLSDVKQGWDHPDARRLRLSLLHTPAIGRRFRYQRRQDFGLHRFRIGLATFDSGCGCERLAALGDRFRQPLRAFRAPRGGKGRARSWAPIGVGGPAIAVMALKPAEERVDVVLRLRETSGAASATRLELAPSLRVGAELDGTEHELSTERRAVPPLAFGPFAIRTFELQLVSGGATVSEPDPPVRELFLELPRTVHVTSGRGEHPRSGSLGASGRALPRELLPRSLRAGGVTFDLAPLHRAGESHAMPCGGQRLEIPSGFERLSLLAGSFGTGAEVSFEIDGRLHRFSLPGSLAELGRFDELAERWRFFGRSRVSAGWFRRAPLRLRVPHLHDRRGRIDPCRPANLYSVDFPVPGSGGSLLVPRSPEVLIFAATVSTRQALRGAPLAPIFESEWEDG